MTEMELMNSLSPEQKEALAALRQGSTIDDKAPIRMLPIETAVAAPAVSKKKKGGIGIGTIGAALSAVLVFIHPVAALIVFLLTVTITVLAEK